MIIKTKAYARAGLIGNPSDGFHGKTIGASLMTFAEDYRRPFLYLGINTIFIDPDNTIEIESLIHELSKPFYSFKRVDSEVKLIKSPFPLFTTIIAEPIQGEGGDTGDFY